MVPPLPSGVPAAPARRAGALVSQALRDFLRLESAGGILLMVATVLALVVANSPLVGFYQAILETPLQVRVGTLDIAKPLLLWINDGLMAVFFFLIGLELKRELVKGELSHPRKLILPGLGALGGMAVPALCYVLVNRGNPLALQGWAIPAATDIAFTLGILSLFGSRVPVALKAFLVSLAIVDDVGAILIIALFYSGSLSLTALGVAGGALLVLFTLNRRGVRTLAPYVLVGLILWVAVLKSGVHATLAGVALAFFIPITQREGETYSLLEKLEHDLHGVVAFVILPVFALANAGVPLAGMGPEVLLSPVPLGIILGLCVGKFVGIFGLAGLGVRLGWAPLPPGATWGSLAGIAVLCGVGFTMSLFIGSLAFEGGGLPYDGAERLGILVGSLVSGVLGYLILRKSLPAAKAGAEP